MTLFNRDSSDVTSANWGGRSKQSINQLSYRKYLKCILEDRIFKNYSYSLRAMAKSLEMQVSQLSEVLNGKANLSLQRARRIAVKLELSQRDAEIFCLRVQLETSKDPEDKFLLIQQIEKLLPRRKSSVTDLSVDIYKQIADWQHSAILELFDIQGFSFDASTISKRLGISKLIAESSMDRLERLGLIGKDELGRWFKTAEYYHFQPTDKKEALFHFYRQMMQKASEALETQKLIEERISGYRTFAISKEALSEMDQAIDRFYLEMERIAEKYPKKTDVYHLNIQFFNLTPSRKEGKK